jgi:hypothetical protein
MKKFVQVVGMAAIAAAASWAVQRWLDRRYAPAPLKVRKPVETWENEGGALAPLGHGLETSQVPR